MECRILRYFKIVEEFHSADVRNAAGIGEQIAGGSRAGKKIRPGLCEDKRNTVGLSMNLGIVFL